MAYRIGIDTGSKTIKVAVLDDSGELVCSRYLRHRSDIRTTMADVLHDMVWRHGDLEGSVAVTGSAGIAVAEMLDLPFVQEVVATTRAVQDAFPQADCVIELGGEDAKVIYLTGGLEQRMNATCAGGTGGFIDTIAFMLGVSSHDMGRLSLGASRTYPIASRCAVFAQTDVRPLLNAGASKSDIAASALEAVVRQTLGGLACGRPLQGTVVFLGGPLEHIPDLVRRFRRVLGLTSETGIKPDDAHLFTAMGAALSALGVKGASGGEGPDDARRRASIVSLAELESRLRTAPDPADDLEHLPPLFESDDDLRAFEERHRTARVARTTPFDARGPLFLGLDAGSTTVKCVLVDAGGALVTFDYRPVRGDALKTATEMLADVQRTLPSPRYGCSEQAFIAHATVTGYGEDLLRAGLGFDSGVVETAAHLRAALHIRSDASFVLDIGGQDMKALWVRDGEVSDAVLNEACSSGCGSFIEGTAHALHVSPATFAEEALRAKSPLDLGTKCTVFMTSRVRHAQKIAAPRADIAAGIAYSVVRNVLYRIIGRKRASQLKGTVVVQGGAFKSDAVLRAFELVCGVETVRPDIAHLMGAYGAALIARERAADALFGGLTELAHAKPPSPLSPSGLLSVAQLEALDPVRRTIRCPGCANACTLALVSFGEERLFISGNRCSRAESFVDARGRALDPGEVENIRERDGRSSGPEDADAHDGCLLDLGDGRLPDSRDVVAHRSSAPPNVVACEQRLLARFRNEVSAGPRGACAVGLLTVLNSYENLPFWHTFFRELGFSVLVPQPWVGDVPVRAGRSAESIPSESVCQPAKLAHARLYELADAGATAVFMPRFERGSRCPVSCWYASALRDNVPFLASGEVALLDPEIKVIAARKLVRRASDKSALFACIERLARPYERLRADEFARALDVALAAHERFESDMERACNRAFEWVSADERRHGIVLAGRAYHMDPELLHGIDGELERLGFAVLPSLGLDARLGRVEKLPWKPAKHLMALAEFVAREPSLDLVALRSFNCGFDSVSLELVRDVLKKARRTFTELKIDEIVDTAHVRIRLRTLAEAVEARKRRARSIGGSLDVAGAATDAADATDAVDATAAADAAGATAAYAAAPSIENLAFGLGPADLSCARADVTPDICFTAAALIAHAIRQVRANPHLRCLRVPPVCADCLVDALPYELERAVGFTPELEWALDWDDAFFGDVRPSAAGAPGTSGTAHSLWRSVRSGDGVQPGDGAPQGDGVRPGGGMSRGDGAPRGIASACPGEGSSARPRIGIVGNALLCFDSYMNEGLCALLEQLGCDIALPDPRNLIADDVRYLSQLDAFARAGVDHVVYVQSFGCLKGHVHARGAAHEFARRYPDMPVTVIDYDPESSALNRENRVRLAVEAAKQARAARSGGAFRV